MRIIPPHERVCHCLSKSKATTTSTPSTATDEGRLATDGSVQVTDEGRASVASGGSNIGGLTISDAGGPVTITTSDPQVIQSALNAVTQLSAGAQSQISDLAATKLTGGETNRDKTILYLGAAGFAALAYIASRK